jgi:hypothetical protein
MVVASQFAAYLGTKAIEPQAHAAKWNKKNSVVHLLLA